MSIIDIPALLNPICDDKITGVDLRQDVSPSSRYYQIKDARQSARNAERRMADGLSTTSSADDWEKVFTLGQDILKNHSKDLEVMAWLIESLLRKFGINGLQAGFLLAKNSISQYWDQLYPQLDPDDPDALEIKVASFSGLNGVDNPGSLILPISHILLTDNKSSLSIKLWQYKRAIAASKLSDTTKRDQRYQEMGFTPEEIRQAVVESSENFYTTLLADVDNTLRAYRELDHVFMDKCGDHAPPTSMIKESLIDLRDHIIFILHDSPFVDVLSAKSSKNIANAPKALKTPFIAKKKKTSGIKIDNRKHALQVINAVDSWFLHNEPHSPIPYLLKRACKWAAMPFPELLNDLIEEEQIRKNIFKLMGVAIET